MIRPTAPQLCAAVAALILAMAVTVWWTGDLPVLYLGPPTITAPPVQVLTVHVPDIGAFEDFTAIPDNPFIPYEERMRQRYRHRGHYPDDAPPPAPPAPPPAAVAAGPVPPLVLPSLVPASATAPTCIGLVDVVGHQQLSVVMPDQPFAVSMRVGDSLAGWTLIAISNGNEATFIGPDGDQEVYPIGQGSLAVAPGGASAAPSGPAPLPHARHQHAHNRPHGPLGGAGDGHSGVPRWQPGGSQGGTGGTPPGSPLSGGSSARGAPTLFGGSDNGP
jgi:hypothetical protein